MQMQRQEREEEKMNPLLKGAEQLRYYSPIYEPLYDEEDNVIDEEMVRVGTDVLDTFIKPVHTDGKPRYYRLRYPVHAKEHKRRWSQWLTNQIADSNPYRVKVSKIGRRVLFEVDPNFQTKRDKALRRIQATIAREQQLAARNSSKENTWEDVPQNAIDLHFERELQERREYE